MKENKQAVTMVATGIKCDNPECDFADFTVTMEDYEQWVNRPCPKCGANLLTEADFKNVQMLMKLATMVNKSVSVENPDESEMVQMHIGMDGTGKMDVSIEKAEK